VNLLIQPARNRAAGTNTHGPAIAAKTSDGTRDCDREISISICRVADIHPDYRAEVRVVGALAGFRHERTRRRVKTIDEDAARYCGRSEAIAARIKPAVRK
jgi:hypothetical protein